MIAKRQFLFVLAVAAVLGSGCTEGRCSAADLGTVTPSPFPQQYDIASSMDSSLGSLYAAQRDRRLSASELSSGFPGLEFAADGAVLVWVMQAPGKTTACIDISAIESYGGRIAGRSDHFLEAWIPVAALPLIANDVRGVTFLRVPARATPAYVTEGVAVTGAGTYQAAGFGGAGVKVAIIDGGFAGLSGAVLSGELPSDIVAVDFTGTGIESGEVHGTACAEIVHDMTPDAQLYILKIGLPSSFENAAQYCVDQGVDIVSMSLFWLNLNFFDGKGDLCQLIDGLYAANVLPVICAGNSGGNVDDAHNEGVITDAAPLDGWHEFAPGVEAMAFDAVANAPVMLVLTWDAWPVTSEDLDMDVIDRWGNEWWWSAIRQIGFQPPLEGGTFVPPYTDTYFIRIYRFNAPTGIRYELYGMGNGIGLPDGFQYPVAASSIICPADAAGALAVGAIEWGKWITGPQEPFSSQGPTNDGRLKPEICGPDGVSTWVYSGSPFWGTSAATPHVAGAAALLKSEHQDWTASDLRRELIADAADMGIPGPDMIYGNGRLQLPPISDTVTITSGPSGTPNPVGSSGAVSCSVSATDSLGHALSYHWSASAGSFDNADIQYPVWQAPANTTGATQSYSIDVQVNCSQGMSAERSYQESVTSPLHMSVPLPTGVVQFSVPVLNSGDAAGRFTLRQIISDPGAAISHPDTGEVGWWSPSGQAYTYSTLDAALNPGYSYFVELSRACSLDMTGDPFSLGVDCAAGWNMIGSGSQSCAWSQVHHPPVDSNLWHWDTVTQQYVVAPDLQPGLGYWVHTTSGGLLTSSWLGEATQDSTGTAFVPNDGPVPPIDGPVLMDFADVPAGYWAYTEVGEMRWLGVVAGYSAGPRTFLPGGVVTRDQMAAFLCRAYLVTGDDSPSPSFTDVPKDQWACRYIEALSVTGIVQGYPDGTYQPDLPVSRDQMAVFLARAAKLEMVPPTDAPFADVPVDYWAAPAIAAVRRSGIVQGYPGTPPTYHPQDVVTRDQLCVFLDRALACPPGN